MGQRAGGGWTRDGQNGTGKQQKDGFTAGGRRTTSNVQRETDRRATAGDERRRRLQEKTKGKHVVEHGCGAQSRCASQGSAAVISDVLG